MVWREQKYHWFLQRLFSKSSRPTIYPAILKDEDLKEKLNPNELAAWNAFESVVQNFLGNSKAFFACSSTFFPENNGDVSDEHGERFHPEIKIIEERYQRNVSPAMMADFCWSLQRDTNEDHRRKRRCPQHF